MKTYAPSSTKSLAVASAMPDVPPVITATLFSSFFMMRVFQIRASENSSPPARADGLTVIQANSSYARKNIVVWAAQK